MVMHNGYFPPTCTRVSDLKIAEGNGKLQLTIKYAKMHILKLSDHVMYRIVISNSEKYIDTFRYQQKINISPNTTGKPHIINNTYARRKVGNRFGSV